MTRFAWARGFKDVGLRTGRGCAREKDLSGTRSGKLEADDRKEDFHSRRLRVRKTLANRKRSRRGLV